MVDHFNLLLIHQTPHYVELLPGTLMSPSHTHTVPQTLGSSQTCDEGGSLEGQSRSSHVTFCACMDKHKICR